MVLRWLRRLVIALLLVLAALLAPVAYVETLCRGNSTPDTYTPLLPPEHRRPESRTLLTYPEWHIVHAYDDYARVISDGDPHDFGYLRSIAGYWTSLCALSEAAAHHGGVDGETRQMVYVIGASFSLEMALKAAYEETLGRIFAALRGAERTALDDLSALQAADYARFLQQTPWYKWDFRADVADLAARASPALRDRERRVALGVEYRAKAVYADVIGAAVAGIGADELRLRMIVRGPGAGALSGQDAVTVIAGHRDGTEIETPRYRRLTRLLADMAGQGADFVEIGGNDDILLTVLSDAATAEGAIYSFPRQGYGDYRHLLLVRVTDLAATLRGLAGRGLRLEHIHDY